MKEIDMQILKERGWYWYDKIRRRLVPDGSLPSYCERCCCQRVHKLISFSYRTAIFECTYCKFQRS